jgi:hypothetical protein
MQTAIAARSTALAFAAYLRVADVNSKRIRQTKQNIPAIIRRAGGSLDLETEADRSKAARLVLSAAKRMPREPHTRDIWHFKPIRGHGRKC